MYRLMLALGKRQRLWPPDDAVSVASLGFLGSARSAYVPPERALDGLAALLWLAGIEGPSGRRRESYAMQAGDQAAIECYAYAVASAVLGVEAGWPRSAEDFPRQSEWTHIDLARLEGQGVAHGQSMRRVLLDFRGRYRRAGGDASGKGDAQAPPHDAESEGQGRRSEPSPGEASLVTGLLSELACHWRAGHDADGLRRWAG